MSPSSSADVTGDDPPLSRDFFYSDHFGRRWREVAWSRPMDYATWLTSRGFTVYLLRLTPDDPDYKAGQRAMQNSARISWFCEERDMRLWAEGHGHSDDDAIAMAYGRTALYREQQKDLTVEQR